jgi:hypothetical protein
MLLPVFDSEGRQFADAMYADVRRELTGRFGGVTAYVRSPATGLWKRDDGTIDRDQMVMVEVMVDELDAEWWAAYRVQLERRFQQDAIVARALSISPL